MRAWRAAGVAFLGPPPPPPPPPSPSFSLLLLLPLSLFSLLSLSLFVIFFCCFSLSLSLSLSLHSQEISGTPTTGIFSNAPPVQMGGALRTVAFPFLQGLEASEAPRYKLGSLLRYKSEVYRQYFSGKLYRLGVPDRALGRGSYSPKRCVPPSRCLLQSPFFLNLF